ncbi:MAG: UDP-2,3-diacylglucosamine diphosphatase [Saprospiraceae bacterium]
MRRDLEVVVISDIHLGTYGCHAKELLHYLKSINPKTLVLNGDIIDIWNFSKHYFPKSHMKVLQQILKLTQNGTKTYYITGNHDEALRRYSGTKMGNLILDDKLILELDGKKTWIFHGDIFDATTKGWARILAKLGGKGYDILIWFNTLINYLLTLFGREKLSLSRKIKNSVKGAVKWISNFETIAATLAIDQKFDTVICGHIHQSQKRFIANDHGHILYLNSGDWVESCTALEYHKGQWSVYTHDMSLVHSVMDIDTIDHSELPHISRLYENIILSTSYR